MDLSSLAYEDKRSWHLNEAALDHACRDWGAAAEVIKHNLDAMGEHHRIAPRYLQRCYDLLAQGPVEMRTAFLGLTDEGQVLRSIHPFAGLLPERERREILQHTKRPGRLDEAG